MLLQERISKVKQLETQVSVIKKLIEEYLANTNEPIDERWALYQALSSFLRNHVSYVQDFLVKTDGTFLELCEVSDHFNRHELIKVHDFLEDWAGAIVKHGVDPVATKEHILKNNLGSFEFDW